MKRDEKAVAVEEITASLNDAGSVFAFDYRGISVAEGAELRSQLREADTTFRVVKNRLAKRAVAETDAGELEELLSGPTAIAFVKGDPVTAAKALATFAREHGVPTFKGGLMDGAPLDPDSFSAIAMLPALDVLHGQLVFMAASPITMLARGLSQMIGGLAQQLNEIKEKGLVTGEDPPAAEPEADAKPEAAAEPEAEADSEAQAEPTADAEPDSPEPDAEGEAAEPDAGAEEAEGDSDSESEPDPVAPGSEAEEETSAGAADGSATEPDPAAPGREAGESTDTERSGTAADEPDPVAPGSEAEEATGIEQKESES